MTRKLGSMTEGSIPHQISLMQVGEVKWIETTAEDYQKVERAWHMPNKRRSTASANFVISVSVWRAVSMKFADGLVVLVRVERVE